MGMPTAEAAMEKIRNNEGYVERTKMSTAVRTRSRSTTPSTHRCLRADAHHAEQLVRPVRQR